MIKKTTKTKALAVIKENTKNMLNGKLNEAVEKSKQGIIFVYEHKDIYETDVKEIFIEDGTIQRAGYEQFFNNLVRMLEEEKETNLSSDELVNEFYEYMESMDYIFYRLIDENRAKNIDDAVEICKEICYWMPQGIIVNGAWFDTKSDENSVYF